MLKTIQSKLRALMGLVALAIVLVAGVSYRERQHADQGLNNLSSNLLPSGIALGRMATGVISVQYWTQAAATDLLTQTAEMVGTHRAKRDAALADVERSRSVYEALPMREDEARLWQSFAASYATLKQTNEQIWLAILAGDAAKARERMATNAPRYAEVIDLCTRASDIQSVAAQGAIGAAMEARAFANVTAFSVMGLTLVLLFAATSMLATGIWTPIGDLKGIADKLARGELDMEFGARRQDEFGEMQESLRVAVEGWRDVVKLAEAVAEGNAELQITPRGPRDLLSNAVNLVARTFQDTTRQAERVAAGDYTGDFTPRGNKDQLGIAIVRMMGTLKEIGSAAERIAAGDLDVEIASKGERDWISSAINGMAKTLKDAARQANVIADGSYETDLRPRSEKDELGIALQKMTRSLREAAREAAEADWLKVGVASMNELVLGQNDVQALATAAVGAIAKHLDAKVGAFYILDQDGSEAPLRLLGTYAYTARKNLANRFALGEGLVGQAALERKQIVLQHAPEDYVRVVSGLGDTVPRNLCVAPVLFKNELRGVVEVGTLGALTGVHQQYLEQVTSILGVSLEIARNQTILKKQQEELRASNEELQEQTRALEHASQELRAQQVELEQSNAELEIQMKKTKESEVRLRLQQKELAGTNAELETRNEELERQKAEIEAARRNLAGQAEELAIASKYKSEFLANMSHELRTPLNSLLLLARSLRDNPEGNLSEDQRESASVIFASGNDLLNLINEILDLSKIEAGRMDLRLEHVELTDLAQTLVRQFDHMARSQGLKLEVKIDPELPSSMVTDPNRLGQVLKNLMGNALKFTEHGGVTVTFARPGPGDLISRAGLSVENALALRVVDTGIGIPLDKQRIVFEAFQQADSGDRRKYGGTGLGLSISRELVALLGGEIHLASEPGVGSTFTVILPVILPVLPAIDASPGDAPTAERPAAPSLASTRPLAASARAPLASVTPREPAPPGRLVAQVTDDRDAIDEASRTILIIEDDAAFVKVLLGEVRRRGFKCLAALNGKDGLSLAKSFRPSGILLDINLPDTNGWMVLSALKQDVDTRHIPVHIVSGEESSLEGLRIGAIGHARKPLRTEDVDAILATIEKSSASAEKLVLVVEDDPIMRRETVRIIGNGTVHAQEVGTGAEALAALQQRRFDLMVLDLGLPDMQGLELLEAASAARVTLPPIIVYTVRELTGAEELSLRNYADSIIIKDVRSQERLIDEVALFLHRVVNDLPEDKRRTIRHLYESDEQLRGKKILIAEDDMRTMFAMAKLLASHGIAPLKAANGEQALAMLATHPDVDLVLLDMMMPVMDGYEAARQMRRDPRTANLPVIALTAKAMKEDRQKCIEAGCSDYLTKPVDQDRLISLLRVWLSR